MSSETAESSIGTPAEGGTTGSDRGDSATPSAWRSVVRSAGTRVLVLPLSAVLGILITRVIVGSYGKDAFAQYGLLVAIGALLPFADLGMSAAIMNAVGGSADPSRDLHVRRVLITSIRVLVCSGTAIVGASVLISAFGLWPWLLGDGLMPGSGPIAAGLCLALIGITLPVAFGQRVLTGLHKNHVMIALNALQSPIVFGVLVVAAVTGMSWGGTLAPVVAYAATLFLSGLAVVFAARWIRPQIGAALRAVPRVRRERGTKVSDVAWPMLIQAVALPVAMQSDRLVLSHVAGPSDLATYNLSAQMFLPVWQVITSAGAALWPIFARARARRASHESSPVPIAMGFAGAAGAACIVIGVASPWLARLASGGQITVPLSMVVSFTVYLVCQGVQYPLGTFLTDAEGLRYQAALIVMMVPCNLALSIVLASRFGAPGPVIGSAVSAAVFQASGNYVLVRRRLAASRRAAVRSAASSSAA